MCFFFFKKRRRKKKYDKVVEMGTWQSQHGEMNAVAEAQVQRTGDLGCKYRSARLVESTDVIREKKNGGASSRSCTGGRSQVWRGRVSGGEAEGKKNPCNVAETLWVYS